ncbi:MAG TPA: hypothetical protein VGR16_14310, partial [Thermomicrobiales bacterium]|nr:hypothetical protein [Thermomicrobiales bacterium]
MTVSTIWRWSANQPRPAAGAVRAVQRGCPMSPPTRVLQPTLAVRVRGWFLSGAEYIGGHTSRGASWTGLLAREMDNVPLPNGPVTFRTMHTKRWKHRATAKL